jgi:hypothetical protein
MCETSSLSSYRGSTVGNLGLFHGSYSSYPYLHFHQHLCSLSSSASQDGLCNVGIFSVSNSTSYNFSRR